MAPAQVLAAEKLPTDGDARKLLAYRAGRIRGICVLAVLLIHVTGSFDQRMPFDWFTAVLIFANSAARFAVPVFVMLSGFHLSLNSRNERPLPFYRRTLGLLVIPYCLYSALYTFVRGSLQNHQLLSGSGFISAWFWNMLFASAAAHLWFIPAIGGLYLVHPFLRGWYRRAGHGGLVIVGVIVAQTAFLVGDEMLALSPEPAPWVSAGRVWLSFLPYVGYFALGYVLADHAARIIATVQRRASRVGAAAMCIITALAMSAYWVVPLSNRITFSSLRYPWLAMKLLQLPLAVGSLVLLTTWKPQRALPVCVGRFADRCGLYAYGVYYIHPLLMIFFGLFWRLGLGLNATHLSYYVWAFPVISVLSVQSVRALARYSAARYLVG